MSTGAKANNRSMGNIRLQNLLLYLGAYIIAASICANLVIGRLYGDGCTISYDGKLAMNFPTLEDDEEVITTDANIRYDGQEWSCDTQNSPDFLPDSEAVKRALHAVIIGAMKGGTQALHTMLVAGHPRILTSSKGMGELHFFSEAGMARNMPRDAFTRLRDRVILRQDFRDEFMNIINDRKRFTQTRNGTMDIANEKNEHKVGIHSAPIYIFSGRRVPARLLCVAPWAKVLAIVRNPIDRAFSDYNFIGHRKRGRPNFENYILEDIRTLKSSGVIHDWTQIDFDTFSGSEEEFDAWEKYVKRARGTGPVGRGLYAIQLEIWMDEFNKVNKSIADDLLVLQSEESKEYPKQAFNQAVEFLGLNKKRKVNKDLLHHDHHQTDYRHEGMSTETYKMLYDLYAPYNKRLYKLLGEDEWGGTWDDREMESKNKH